MVRFADTYEAQHAAKPVLDLEASPITAASLKLFFDSHKTQMDSDKNGFINKKELEKFKETQNPISCQYRLADSLSSRVEDIQALSRDEHGFLVFSDKKGISSTDMNVLDVASKGNAENKLIKSVNEELASKQYEDIIKNAQELNEDTFHMVVFKFKKSTFSLDPWTHIKNEAAAVRRVTMVGERQFNNYAVGQTISEKFDAMALFDLEFSTYRASIDEKYKVSSHSWKNAAGVDRAMSPAVYSAVRDELKQHGRTLLDAKYAGSTNTIVSDKQISEGNIVDRKPLERYYVEVNFRNSSLSLDIFKHVRNALNTHLVELEVPEKVYKNADSLWEPRVSAGSVLMTGRLSRMHGDIKRKWTEIDPGFEKVTTDKGQIFVRPKPRA